MIVLALLRDLEDAMDRLCHEKDLSLSFRDKMKDFHVDAVKESIRLRAELNPRTISGQ